MEKRLPLALFLSFLVLFAWTMLHPRPPRPVEGADAARELGARGEGGPVPGATLATPPDDEARAARPGILEPEERRLELFVGGGAGADDPLRRGHYRLVFSNRGARLSELFLGGFYRTVGLDDEQRRDPENWLPLVEAIETESGPTGSLLVDTRASSAELAPFGLANALWAMRELEGDVRGVEFTYAAPGSGVVFTKRITVLPGTWELALELSIENRSDRPARAYEFALTPAGCVPGELGDSFYTEPRAVAVGGDERNLKIEWEGAPGLDEGDVFNVPEPLAYAGVYNKYFAFLLRPDGAPARRSLSSARYEPVRPLPGSWPADRPSDFVRTVLPLKLPLPGPGETSETYRYLVYAGPKLAEEIAADHRPHELVLESDLSTFSSIGHVLLVILSFFHRLTGNWGWAIILLTICVRVALFPLNRRSQTAMARYQNKMRRVQPKLEEIKRRFANDPQKQREAQARLMQEEGAFPPLGGCLPMLLQIPIFFGLFSALRTSPDLRQAPFMLWVTDLARPDQLLELDLRLPLLPDIRYLNLLPLLMVVLWILQQRGMPKPADEQQAKMQRMMAFMPIVFGFMLYNYAAGLSLYMITQSTLGIVEQRVIKKFWPIDDREPERKPRKGCGPFAGMMEHLAEKQREQARRMATLQQSGAKKQRRKRR